MRASALAIALWLVASPALADTRTVQVDTATGFVAAIIYGPVTTPAPAGRTFIVLTDDAVQVESGWTYNATTHTFSPPGAPR